MAITTRALFNIPNYQDPRWDLPANENLEIMDLYSCGCPALEAILSSVSAVDVFIYDTRNDSDGGQWRDRMGHTSWENETLNTATRGHSRKFPVIVAVVAEIDKVTIFDLTEPDTPMWIVFNTNYNYMIRDTQTGVTMLNGVMSMSTDSGLTSVFFLKDSRTRYVTAASYDYNGNIAERNDALNQSDNGKGLTIINTGCNDVAMTLLEDRAYQLAINGAFDTDTGWTKGTGWAIGSSVATWTVGSSGGITQDTPAVIGKKYTLTVQIVSCDETAAHGIQLIYDGITQPTVYYESGIYTVDFTATVDTGSIGVWARSTNVEDVVIDNFSILEADFSRIDPETNLLIPTIAVATDGGVSVIDSPAGLDTVVDSGAVTAMNTIAFEEDVLLYSDATGGYAAETYVFDGFGFLVINNLGVPALLDANTQAFDNFVFGGVSGITMLYGDMVNYITKDYQSGWMQGDIKGGWLADTVEGALANEVVNSDFATDTVWIKDSAWTISGGTANSDGTSFANIRQLGILEAGKNYTLTFDILNATSGYDKIGIRTDGATEAGDATGNGTHTIPLNAVDGTGIYIYAFNGASGRFDGSVDNVSIIEVVADRSVNDNPLTVVGSGLTRTAVAEGSELVEYDGFTNANYLHQDVNSDLGFGTGDFYIMGWMKTPAVSNQKFLLNWANPSYTGSLFQLDIKSTGDKLRFFSIGTVGGYNVESTSDVDTDKPVFFTIKRNNTGCYIYINAVLEGSEIEAPSEMLSTDQELFIGTKSTKASAYDSGSLALLRIGAGAPSDEQIAKIYNDEKELFNTNTACTLQGISDDVKALSYDKHEDIVYAGTGSGATKFKGFVAEAVEVCVRDGEETTCTSISDYDAVSAHEGVVIHAAASRVVVNSPTLTHREAIHNITHPIFVDYQPLVCPPAHKEGRSFYCLKTHSFSVQTDIPGVVWNGPLEQYIRIINLSGETILNGKACRQNGVDPETKVPRIVLAIANSIVNARILGVATSDIKHGEEGFITTFGDVNDFDTSSYIQGVPAYLSDTVAGDYTNTAPDIVTQVGGVVRSDVHGSLKVSIINHIALPTLFGVLQGMVGTYILTSSYQDIVGYTVEDGIILSPNKTTGIIPLPNNGWYRATFNTNVTLSDTPSVGTWIIDLQLWNETKSTEMGVTTLSITATSAIASRSASAPFLITSVAEDGDEMILRVKSADTTDTLTFDSLSFDIESINIR